MSGLRIDAGANRPAGPQRLNFTAPRSLSTRAGAAAAATTAPVNAGAFARLREVMDQINGPLTDDQQEALQAELDRLRTTLVDEGTDSGEVQATMEHLSVASQNVAASRSRLSDIGAARAAAQLAQEQIRSQLPAALQAQANAAARSTRDLLNS